MLRERNARLRCAVLSLSMCLLAAFPACRPGDSGRAPGLHLLEVTWGRRVCVRDANGERVRRHVVVGEDIGTSGAGFELATNPVTQETTLTIPHARGSVAFEEAFARLGRNRGFLEPRSLRAVGAFVAVPRNAALRLVFDRDLDEASIDELSVAIVSADARSSRLPLLRFVDPAEPNVLLLDPVIGSYAARRHGLEPTPRGFAEGRRDRTLGFLLRLPTVDTPAATSILRSRDGAALQPDETPVDPPRATVVVRGFQARRTSDANRGYLSNQVRPRIVARQSVALTRVSGDELTYVSELDACHFVPRVGDVLEQGMRVGEIVTVLSTSTEEDAVVVRRVDDEGTPFSTVEPAHLWHAYQGAPDLPGCFVTFTEEPVSLPTTGVSPRAGVSVRFSEPMDPLSMRPFDTFLVSETEEPTGARSDQWVVGDVLPSVDLTEFTFVPAGEGMRHDAGAQECYHVHLVGAESTHASIHDLSGARLRSSTFSAGFVVDSLAPRNGSRSLALTFRSTNESGGNRIDHAGQLVPETVPGRPGELTGRHRGRDVSRFSRWIDPSRPTIGAMWTQTYWYRAPSVVPEPLVAEGARVVSVWRHIDLGFSFPLTVHHNLDVEGMAFSPAGLRTYYDVFRRVRLSLAHSYYLPDESIDVTGHRLPVYPNSGLARHAFRANVAGGASHPSRVMFDGTFTVDPGEVTYAPVSGVPMLSWPAFRNAFGDRVTYTWRDTTIDAVGGPAGDGCDPAILEIVLGSRVRYVGPAQVPSIGLPLLFDIQVWPAEPEDDTRGFNEFQTSIAASRSALPTFRVFSAGGHDTAGNPRLVNPEEEVPRGGYNRRAERGPLGVRTRPDDALVYWGRVDFVVKVSRQITRWFDMGPASVRIVDFVVVPGARQQPEGTSLIVEFRGARSVTEGSLSATRADCMDPYGVVPVPSWNPNCTGIPGTALEVTPWTTDPTTFVDKRWLQMRVTCISNTETLEAAAIDGLGVVWEVGS